MRPGLPAGGALGLAAVVVAALVAYGALSSFVENPRIYVDELRYMDAASSFAHGHGLELRGERYDFAPAYPLALAPILRASHDRSGAYVWIKLANALFFALAAVPVYLLARRLLSSGASVAVAALALVVPSSVYVGLVLTESLAYLASSLALYAIVIAVERPSIARQLCALGAVALAYLVRPQFGTLYVTYLVAFVLSARRNGSSRRSDRLRTFAPTAASVVLVLLTAVLTLALRRSAALGAYADLWRSYDAIAVARWAVYYAGDLALYLALIPIALLPPAVVALRRRAHAGSASAASFLVVFVVGNVFALVVAAAFSSTPYSHGLLHDRYLFYVVPLWLILGAAWFRDRVHNRRAAIAGVFLLLAVIAAFPAGRFVVDDGWRQLTATGTPVWSHFADWAVGHGLSSHRAIGIAALAAALVAFVPKRLAWALAVPVAAVFLGNSVLLWKGGIEDSQKRVFAARTSAARAWIDATIPSGEAVTMLDVPTRRCALLGPALPLTEFFNDRVGDVLTLGTPLADGLPSASVRVRADGAIVDDAGVPLAADWLLARLGVDVRGTRIRSGALGRLVLWKVSEHVAVRAHSSRQLEAQACSGLGRSRHA